MVRRVVLIALCAAAATTAQGQTAVEPRQRQACGMFSSALDGMDKAIEKSQSPFRGNAFANIATDLPKSAADAALKAQRTQEALFLSFKAHKEAFEDLSYQLKACSR